MTYLGPSRVKAVRKPDPRIYLAACAELGVSDRRLSLYDVTAERGL